jgi:TetR/AcrR family transcriptional regulator, regulator of cefoperazone and chloramphenicol sensitivity
MHQAKPAQHASDQFPTPSNHSTLHLNASAQATSAPPAAATPPTHPTHPTQDALLDAAEELFSERGYAAVGIREIAERARANIAAIKYHFGCKSELYLATVRRAMSRGDATAVWDVLRDTPRESERAGTTLVRFIRLFLRRLLSEGDQGGTRCCALMLREATEPSEAIDAVVRDFIEPHQRMLMDVIDAAAAPHTLDQRHLAAAATSVLGQILHYRVFRPFLQRLPQCAAHADDIDFLVRHIARFSLRGVGVQEAAIERIISAAMAVDQPPQPRITPARA